MTAAAPLDHEAAARLWEEYSRGTPHLADAEYTVERFGDSAEMADELLGLVLHGGKRATASLLADFAHDKTPLPRIGVHWIVCDGSGTPRAVLRTTELRIGPFHSVDDAFAWDEGENDRTRDGWMREHSRYWQRVRAAQGATWSESDEVLFERFQVVHPR
ncbi:MULTISPECIES: ASCH domain-containing protein [Actinoplanes]|uniref:ASCH domain-containing protein n=1 Tax=Actinoplanes TaxID=1865 RepID=UPI0005F2F91A|nr:MULTISPECIES: ASCH domain-containing protein [Actinoplanes]GLY07673.1 hypothetical protein Acsp01_80520 [Actinoplanes sp. NBRC 101535]